MAEPARSRLPPPPARNEWSETVKSAWDHLACSAYIYYYVAANHIREKISGVVLVLLSFFGLLELLAPILHLPALHLPPAIAYPLFFVLCPLSIMLFLHHRHLGAVAQDHKKLLSTLQILIGHVATPDDGMSSDDMIKVTLAALGETLGNHIFVVYLELEHAQGHTELVSYAHFPERECYFDKLRLDVRASAAGRACTKRAVVYVPCYRRRHGIRVEERLTDAAKIETLCLEMDMTQSGGKPPFDSLLCAPVFVRNDVAGCVCFGSPKRNAFGRFHFSAARTAARLLGIYLGHRGA